MEIQQDFRELLELLNRHEVDFIIVGGYALAYHGAPRFTGDLDLLVRSDRDNAEKILATLNSFGFGSLALTIEDFTTPGRVVQLGVAPVRVDFLTSITGVPWVQAWSHRAMGSYGDLPVSFIGKEELVANKRALGRHRDLADIEALGC